MGDERRVHAAGRMASEVVFDRTEESRLRARVAELEGEVGRLRDESTALNNFATMQVRRAEKSDDRAACVAKSYPTPTHQSSYYDFDGIPVHPGAAVDELRRRLEDERDTFDRLNRVHESVLRERDAAIARAEKAEMDRDAARRVIHEERILTHEATARATAAEAREAGLRGELSDLRDRFSVVDNADERWSDAAQECERLREALLSCKNIACDSLTEPEKEEYITEIVDAALAAPAKGKGDRP